MLNATDNLPAGQMIPEWTENDRAAAASENLDGQQNARGRWQSLMESAITFIYSDCNQTIMTDAVKEMEQYLIHFVSCHISG